MAYSKKSYVEHVAVRVKDIHWHIRFFREVLGMTVRQIEGSAENPSQYWSVGGMQLIADPSFEGPEGRLGHLGVMVEDLVEVLREAQGWGLSEMSQGRNWLQLPDGLTVELMQASGNAMAEALAVSPRA